MILVQVVPVAITIVMPMAMVSGPTKPSNSTEFPSAPLTVTVPLSATRMPARRSWVVSLGVTATYGLTFLGEDYGAWNIHGGLTYYVTDSDVVANSPAGRPDNDFLTANIGIGCAF